uniref:ARAD1C06028p n=1 Tax=Blastobotrys adeninivorans TaxID=409370 RepID=A0A060SZN9_BLAAD
MLSTPDSRVDPDKVYEPAEDTFLLLDVLESEKEYIQQRLGNSPLVTEIGTGSGVVTTFIRQHIVPNGYFMPTDVNFYACTTCTETWEANGMKNDHLDPIRCNLVSALRVPVDLMVFNPPYVPSEDGDIELPESDDDPRWVDIALVGGHDGMRITNQLLGQLKEKLSLEGIAYILFCKRNHPEAVAQSLIKDGWNVERIEERKAGWEVLSVYKITHPSSHPSG